MVAVEVGPTAGRADAGGARHARSRSMRGLGRHRLPVDRMVRYAVPLGVATALLAIIAVALVVSDAVLR